MKQTRWIVALLSLALVVGMIAVFAVSCGDGGGSDTTTATTGGTDDTTATTAEPESTTTTEDPGTTYTGDDAFVVSVGMPSSASLYNTYLVPWTEAVAAASDGRIEFALHSANTLVKETQQVDSVLNGTTDITVFQADWDPGRFPLIEFGLMPMMFPDTIVAAQVMWDLMEEYGQEELSEFHVLGIGFISAAQYGGTVPAHVPSDLVGKRLRSGGATETEVIEALGATPVENETDALATQIERGAFDGMFLSWSFHAGNTNNWATQWSEVGLFVRPLVFVMSQERWDGLPAAVQKAFDDNSGVEAAISYLAVEEQYVVDNASVAGQKDRGLDRAAIEERAAGLGTSVYELSDAERLEWKTAVEPVVQRWADMYSGRLDTQAVLDRAEELIEQYSAQ